MAWETLENYIDDKIRDKLPVKISADDDHNPTLHAIVDTFGQDFIYSGVANRFTNPINDDNKRYYIANGSVGVYVNFLDENTDPLELDNGEFAVFAGVNNVWSSNKVTLNQLFTDASDTPSTYASAAGYTVKVNDAGTGLEFVLVNEFTDDYKDQIDANEEDITHLEAALDDLVPFTGAPENLDLGAYDIIATDGVFENVTTNEIIDSNGSSGDLGDFLVKGSGGVEWQDKSVTTVDASTYSVLATDKILHVTYTATGACTIEFSGSVLTDGFKLMIKDAGGNAGTNNITLDAGEAFIDGEATQIINANYTAINLYSDGTNLFIY